MIRHREAAMHHTVRVLALALLVGGCASVRAQSDYDPNARFDTFHTFAWTGQEPGRLPNESGGERKPLDPLLARRIKEAIDTQLEAKGYKLTKDLGKADFAVSFSVGTREKIRVQSSPTYYGGGYGYGGWYAGSGVSTQSYTEGTLAIDIFDGKSHMAVWHGWASKRVNESSDRAKVVDEVVTAILAKFPPPR
jgi:hypothetical protein